MPSPSKPSLLSLSLLFFLPSTILASSSSNLGAVNPDDLIDPSTGYLNPQAYLSTHPKPPSTSSHAPWTTPPLCHTSASNSSLKFCTYTSAPSFLNGLSLITTPALAGLAIPHLDEHPVLQFFPSDAEAEDFLGTSRPYAVEDIPGKGKGVVATRRIAQYETFMVDQANVVMDNRIEKALTASQSLELLRRGVDGLRDPGRVRGLSGEHAGSKQSKSKMEGEKGEETVDDKDEHVMLTNSFGTEFEGENFRAVFPLVSRVNHACDPNSFVMFSATSLSIALKSYRPILPGEEITISYVYLGTPTPHRASQLKKWGFECDCSLCSRPKKEIEESDERRRRIQEGEMEFQRLWEQERYQAAIAKGKELVKLIGEEGLTPM
ncbi:SET domain-containing protein [Aaosphaeria arxii CBS 175.79]|uniref:SET domain-containing protein n=1 Tax=Aaosphaeria arxii CBS 175.79 TaxID=1450172 RepID=A0A6A5XM43_9PLEO|nr:SET domain-containing protein [Aaosphaeria arxii CBS 175.79]KAF2014013.1 SET domain-containing protein [Aaosphaeria arxii CBS 175.79]